MAKNRAEPKLDQFGVKSMEFDQFGGKSTESGFETYGWREKSEVSLVSFTHKGSDCARHPKATADRCYTR